MNREGAETYLRLLAEEELRRVVAWYSDGPSGSWPADDAGHPVGVSGAVAGSLAGPETWMASAGGWSADRAVAELYPVHYPALVRLAAGLVGDVHVAEEVVQDSFVAMHGGWQRLGDAEAALAYLRQAVVNRSRAVLRHGPVPGSSPQQVRAGGSGGHPVRVARAAQLLTAVNRRAQYHVLRVIRVAQVLTSVGALDDRVADQILADFELAMAIRQAASPRWPGRGPGSWRRSSPMRPRSAMRAAGVGPGAAPARVVRLGQVIPVRDEDVSGEVYLLSYVQTASGPQLSLLARARRWIGPPGPGQPDPAMPPAGRPDAALVRPWPVASRLEQFTATDDQGASYEMTVRALGGGPDGWTLMLHPRPPHNPRWLDLTTTPGEPAVRVDLNPSAPAAQDATMVVDAAPVSPSEQLLHAIAARLLATPLTAPASTRLHPAEPGPLATAADGLGNVIAALQAAGALSPLSPVPGQLAALCARLHLTGHDIAALPARDLPAPWLSMLAHYHRKTGAARDGCAATAVTLPELDGIRLAILGLHNCQGRTVVHMHASGPLCQAKH